MTRTQALELARQIMHDIRMVEPCHPSNVEARIAATILLDEIARMDEAEQSKTYRRSA